MAIIRTHRNGSFTVIPNEIIGDERLAWQELGLLVYLLSKPEDWEIRVPLLAKDRDLKERTLYGILKHLQELGYASFKKLRSGATEWIITDNPSSPVFEPHGKNCSEQILQPANFADSKKPHGKNCNAILKTEIQPKTELNNKITTQHRARETEDKRPENTKPGADGPDDGESPKASTRAKPKTTIPDNWTPSDRCMELIARAGISPDFAESQIGEFVLYWQETGEKRPGWDATFLTRCKTQWDWIQQQKTPVATNQKPGFSQTKRGDYERVYRGPQSGENGGFAEKYSATLGIGGGGGYPIGGSQVAD